MTYDMLGLFSFTEDSATNFRIDFEIPDNCFYLCTPVTAGQYTISIKLNPGETQPSTTFVSCTENTAIVGKVYVTTFEQCNKTTTITKPKVTIAF